MHCTVGTVLMASWVGAGAALSFIRTGQSQQQHARNLQGLPSPSPNVDVMTRRQAWEQALVTTATGAVMMELVRPWCTPSPALAATEATLADSLPDRFDVENFIRTGMVPNPMGVSGQAGKSRPETGVMLVEGSNVSRDAKTGNVFAEILVKAASPTSKAVPVLTSYASPWPLATGQVFDVECRDPNTGDGAYLAVTSETKGRTLLELDDAFFVNNLIGPTGRFSSYGTPTDVKVKSSVLREQYRYMDISFSTLSQSTQTEIPRVARVVATIPEGTQQAVMLIGSASASRWKRGSDRTIASVIDSFRAIPAPQSALKLRAKERRN